MTNAETELDPVGDRRRLVGFALLGAAIIIAVVALLVSSPWSSDADTDTDDAPDTTQTTRDTTATTAVAAPGTDLDQTPADQTPADQIPVATVDVTGPGGACAAVVARLQTYSAAARRSAIPELRLLFEKLSQFEGEIFQVAQTQAWGDQLIEQLVVVRRGWVDAGSTLRSGDDAAARQHADQATALLDQAIAGTVC